MLPELELRLQVGVTIEVLASAIRVMAGLAPELPGSVKVNIVEKLSDS
jgi:hypothetical protein